MIQFHIPNEMPILSEVLGAYDFPATLLGAVSLRKVMLSVLFFRDCPLRPSPIPMS